ncbi:MAG: UDP-N-acetylmuramate--L-alanine ligase [Candidatus Riflebacteria bacterium]|nr:UDP-N-acetylmuramate--L-alanine ligase [Candidatus Riflebacteria bacterium]
MSGLARIYASKGYNVSGSDRSSNTQTHDLKLAGVIVYDMHSSENLPLVDDLAVVVSTAIPENNPELIEAKRRGLRILHRSDLLANLINSHAFSIAVAGCHGKTTVSSMLSSIFVSAGKDPTCVVGGYVNELKGNCHTGSSDILIAEADESDGTFLKYKPTHAIITNVDNDHIEHYSTLEAIIRAFESFAANIEQEGKLYLCNDSPIARNLLLPEELDIVSYGIDIPSDYSAENITYHPFGSSFDCIHRGQKLGTITLAVPGKHNILNALAAVSVSLDFGISFEQITSALSVFAGAGRRFELKGRYEGITVIDDYGHHPNEIKATLEAATTLGAERIVVVFQPHRYTRTLFLSNEFGRCFDNCDKLFITDIYPASEKPIQGVTSRIILDSMPVSNRRKVKMVKNVEDAKYLLMDYLKPGDVVFTIGAGSITELGHQVLESIKARNSVAPMAINAAAV